MFITNNLIAKYNDDGNVVLFWGVFNDEGGKYQSEYRVTFADYDSGWVKSGSQTVEIKPNAEIGDLIIWSVKVKDENGKESDESSSEFISMTESKSFGDNGAIWIKSAESEDGKPVRFMKNFSLCELPERAFLVSSVAGLKSAQLNGKIIGDGVLMPNTSNYLVRRYYNVDDITNFLEENNNLCIDCGGGWRTNDGTYYPKDVRDQVTFFGDIELIAYIKLIYKDRIEIIATDESFTCSGFKTVYSNLYQGEVYDDRVDEGALPATNAIAVCEERPEPIFDFLEPIMEQEIYKPRAILRHEDGSYIIDFGQNIQGYIEIRLPSLPSGSEITILHAEELDEDETLYRGTLRWAKAEDKIISAGKEIIWKPVFVYHGFRYASISGFEGQLDAKCVNAILISTDISKDSWFECGSAILNAIQKNIVMTERDNLIGLATDCPQRDERMGWMNDTTVRFSETPYNFDVTTLFPKIIRDVTDEQSEDGAITCTAPYIYGSRPADPVCSSYLVAAYRNWLHNGDVSPIKRFYKNFAAWSAYLEKRSDNGIVDYSYYGDWAGPQYACVGAGACSAVTTGVFMSSGYNYYNAKLLALFAGLIGDEEEKKMQEKRAEYIKNAMLEKWFDADTLSLDNNSQGDYAFALWLGLIPTEYCEAVAKKLNDSVVGNGYKITTGNLTTVYLLEMLSDYGYSDTAYKLMTSEEYPSYGYMIQNSATTIWERFELKKDTGMNSHNHPMFGSVGSWLYSHLAGIKPLDAGYSRVLIKPTIPEDLLYTAANVKTFKGDIYVKWHKKYGKTYLAVNIPFGVSADIRFCEICETVEAGFYTYSY